MRKVTTRLCVLSQVENSTHLCPNGLCYSEERKPERILCSWLEDPSIPDLGRLPPAPLQYLFTEEGSTGSQPTSEAEVPVQMGYPMNFPVKGPPNEQSCHPGTQPSAVRTRSSCSCRAWLFTSCSCCKSKVFLHQSPHHSRMKNSKDQKSSKRLPPKHVPANKIPSTAGFRGFFLSFLIYVFIYFEARSHLV